MILLESATKAGARLAVPSLATPVGGLISGIVMSRWGKLAYLVRAGTLLMCVGNLMVMFIQFNDAPWKYFAYVIPASLGQGIVYPGILFTFLAAFDHAGTYRPFIKQEEQKSHNLQTMQYPHPPSTWCAPWAPCGAWQSLRRLYRIPCAQASLRP